MKLPVAAAYWLGDFDSDLGQPTAIASAEAPVTYQWTANVSGVFAAATSDSTSWTAPAVSSNTTVTFTIVATAGGSSGSTTVDVDVNDTDSPPRAAGGSDRHRSQSDVSLDPLDRTDHRRGSDVVRGPVQGNRHEHLDHHHWAVQPVVRGQQP